MFQHELDALHAAGIPFEVDSALLRHRILRITFSHVVHGVDVSGEAVYPDLYPDFRPAVQAQQLGLTHHQNPLGGNLCLLGRGGDRWRPSYNLAWLLTEQLPQVVASGKCGASADAIAAEDVQAEPYSAYVPVEPNSAMLVDGDWVVPPEAEWGRLILGLSAAGPISGAIRAAVLEVRGHDDAVLASADPAIRERYPHVRRGLWGRSDLTNPADLRAVVDEAANKIPNATRSSWPAISAQSAVIRVLGVLVPEEVAHRKSGQGWLFMSIPEAVVGGGGKKKRGTNARTPRTYFARTIYAGPSDMMVRIPELRALASKKIAVFGLGSLGAPAALELARAGVQELRLLDKDHVDAGPSVRWPFGIRDAGVAKTTVLQTFIREHYPYTKVTVHQRELGEPPALGRQPDQTILDEMLSDADLVLDATANLNVQRMLAELARERRLPYVMVEGRHGAWGGVVFRQTADANTPCLYCLQHALQDGGGVDDAPAAQSDGVQPRGCGDVTFTGTSFDMATLALDAVRRVIGTLSAGLYPDPPGNLAVISFRNEDGSACAPTWRTYDLAIHPACSCSEPV